MKGRGGGFGRGVAAIHSWLKGKKGGEFYVGKGGEKVYKGKGAAPSGEPSYRPGMVQTAASVFTQHAREVRAATAAKPALAHTSAPVAHSATTKPPQSANAQHQAALKQARGGLHIPGANPHAQPKAPPPPNRKAARGLANTLNSVVPKPSPQAPAPAPAPAKPTALVAKKPSIGQKLKAGAAAAGSAIKRVGMQARHVVGKITGAAGGMAKNAFQTQIKPGVGMAGEKAKSAGQTAKGLGKNVAAGAGQLMRKGLAGLRDAARTKIATFKENRQFPHAALALKHQKNAAKLLKKGNTQGAFIALKKSRAAEHKHMAHKALTEGLGEDPEQSRHIAIRSLARAAKIERRVAKHEASLSEKKAGSKKGEKPAEEKSEKIKVRAVKRKAA